MKVFLHLALLASAVVAIGACRNAGIVPPTREIAILSPSELNGDPASYHGRRVVVRGYVRLGTNSHSIYESEALANEFAQRLKADGEFRPRQFDRYCLTIANPDRLYRDQAGYHQKTLTLRGVFIQDYLSEDRIDLGACQLPTAILID